METGITVEQLKTQLASVETAINNILTTGQSYVRPGFSLNHAALPSLQDREQYLIRAITRASQGIMAVVEIKGNGGSSAEDNFVNPNSEP